MSTYKDHAVNQPEVRWGPDTMRETLWTITHRIMALGHSYCEEPALSDGLLRKTRLVCHCLNAMIKLVDRRRSVKVSVFWRC